MRLSWPAIFLAFCALAAPALAAAEIVTEFRQDKTENGARYGVIFQTKGCEEECLIASLSCENGIIEAEYADAAPALVAKSIGSGRQELAFLLDGKKTGFFARAFAYQEMTGSFWITAELREDREAFLRALPAAKRVAVRFEKDETKLVATPDLAKWAKACGN